MCIPDLSDCVQLAKANSVLSFRKQLAAITHDSDFTLNKFETIVLLRLTANTAVLDLDLQQR